MTTTPILRFLILVFLSNAPSITLQQELGSVLRWCYDSAGNYTLNTSYQANLLTTLLPSLASNAPLNTTGYYSTAVGRDPDRVFGFAQCMSAANMQDCRSCLNQSTAAIAQLCPRRKQALIRYENCALRYSNQSFVTQADASPYIHYRNTANSTEPALFSRQRGGLLRNLSTESAQSPSRFAAGRTSYNALSDVYGMTQCTRDISSGDCFTCLEQAMGFIGNEIGARIYLPSCSLRFEVYGFYPADGLTAPPPPRPSPPPPSNDASPPPQPPRAEQGNGSSSRTGIIIGVVVGVTSILIIVILFVCCVARKKTVNGVVVEPNSETIDESKPMLFDLNEIRAATDNFSKANELGQGGFGAVYKGTLADGQQIAVKRLLANSNQGIPELKNEVALLAKLQHRNLVKLLGCCLENQENLLIYEFVPNSGLEKFLFDPVKRGELKWNFRIKIIEGIARGLLYLHEDSRLRIIHRDLKSANILLDSDMNAKISDFGLAKIFGADQTQGNTNRIAGTFGYMSPEYAMHGLFSTKSDVFSFGVLVLEIVTGRKNSGFSDTGDSVDLLSHVWKHWTNGNISDLIDENLHEYPVNEVVRCVHIGLLCVQEDPTERPNMSNVVLMLSSESLTISAPSPPAFCILRSGNTYTFATQSKNSNTNSTPTESVNEASITDLYPR